MDRIHPFCRCAGLQIYRPIAVDDRSSGIPDDRGLFDWRLVVIRVLQRAAVLEIRSRALVALPQPRTKSIPAARGLRLGVCNDFSASFLNRGVVRSHAVQAEKPQLNDQLFAANTHRVSTGGRRRSNRPAPLSLRVVRPSDLAILPLP